MAIGTSSGEYFEDAFEHAASQFDSPITNENLKMAGDVLLMGKPEGLHTGPTNQSAPYATGKVQDDQVKSIPIDTLKDWMNRTTNRR